MPLRELADQNAFDAFLQQSDKAAVVVSQASAAAMEAGDIDQLTTSLAAAAGCPVLAVRAAPGKSRAGQ